MRWRDGWTAIEIDGEGHDTVTDFHRRQILELPIVRYKPDELLKGVVDYR